MNKRGLSLAIIAGQIVSPSSIVGAGLGGGQRRGDVSQPGLTAGKNGNADAASFSGHIFFTVS